MCKEKIDAPLPTCVVSYSEIHNIDNHVMSRLSFVSDIDGEKIRFVQSRDIRYAYEDGELIFNYDLLISNKVHDLPYIADIVLPRYTKNYQISHLKSISKKLEKENKLINFKNIKCFNRYNSSTLNGTDMQVDLPDGLIYIRPSDGARGVGNTIFDTTKANIYSFLRLLTKGNSSTFETDMKPFAHAFASSDGMSFKKFIDGDLIKDRYSNQFAVITEVIENISSEIRIITDHNSEIAMTEFRTLSRFKIDYGSLEVPNTIKQVIDDGTAPIKIYRGLAIPKSSPISLTEEIKTLVKELPPMSSVDIFFTEDGKWGIFEFCNQFGCEDFPVQWLQKLHEEFIIDLYRKKFKTGKKQNGNGNLRSKPENQNGSTNSIGSNPL